MINLSDNVKSSLDKINSVKGMYCQALTDFENENVNDNASEITSLLKEEIENMDTIAYKIKSLDYLIDGIDKVIK